jgi:hypothetical protein
MTRLAACLTLALALPATPARAAEEVTLKKVKYDELTRLIAGHKGKVVVVDFWASY